MKLSIVQFAPHFGKPAQNLQSISRLVGDLQTDLMVLPELCFTGYQFQDEQELMGLAESTQGPSLTGLSQLTREFGGLAVAGFAERDGDKIYNSAALVGPEGVLAVYRKLHLFGREKELFTPGDSPPRVLAHEAGRIGMMVCFDWAFPEVARSLALDGVQLLAHPANLVLPHCQAAMVTRCVENRVFSATANRIGQESRLPEQTLCFTGGSRIIAPDGQILAQASQEEETILTVNVDLSWADDKLATAHNHVLEDRRPEFYGRLNCCAGKDSD